MLTSLPSILGSTILRIVYGIEIDSPSDEILVLEEQAMSAIKEAITPGKYLVEALPFLQYLPAWFPGAGWKRQAMKWRVIVDEMFEGPHEELKRALVRAALAAHGPVTNGSIAIGSR